MQTLIPPYRSRRDAMLKALDREHAPRHDVEPPGRRHVRVGHAARTHRRRRIARALAGEERIGFVPGGAFSPNGAVRNTIRLNYSLQTEAGIADGVARLGALVTRVHASP